MAAVLRRPPSRAFPLPPPLTSISSKSPKPFCLYFRRRISTSSIAPTSSIRLDHAPPSLRFVKFVSLASTEGETETIKAEQALQPNIEVDTSLDSIKWDEKDLAVAIAQNVDTVAILMQGFVNRDALAATISSGKATFYSSSTSTLWTKGETSKNFINVHDFFLDCDCDVYTWNFFIGINEAIGHVLCLEFAQSLSST